METSPAFVNLAQLSSLLGLPVAYLEREAKGNRIPYVRAGRSRFFDPNAVRKALTTGREPLATRHQLTAGGSA